MISIPQILFLIHFLNYIPTLNISILLNFYRSTYGSQIYRLGLLYLYSFKN